MEHLVVVEGESDKGFVYGLAERLGVKVKVLKMRGNRPDKVVRIVRAELANQKYSKVIVLKDQHDTSEDVVRRKLQEIKAQIKGHRIHTIMVRRAIEAWMLAGMGISNAESIEKPDEYLNILFRREGRGGYVKSFQKAKQLAKKIKLQEAKNYSPTLKQFIDTLQDP